MEWLDFVETWSVVILTYLLSTIFFLFLIWGYNGFPKGFDELSLLLIVAQLIVLGVIIFVPLIGYYLSTFKIVRR